MSAVQGSDYCKMQPLDIALCKTAGYDIRYPRQEPVSIDPRQSTKAMCLPWLSHLGQLRATMCRAHESERGQEAQR